MTNNYFRIGGHLINILTGQSSFIDPVGSFAPFSTEKTDGEHELFNVELHGKITRELNRKEIVRFEWDEEECTLYHTGRGFEIELVLLADRRRKALMSADENFASAEIESAGGDDIEWFFINNFLMMLFSFASASHKTAMLHASAVTVGKYGYIFLGHSGTGKSTHSRLWLENIKGCRLLNDDNPIVRIINGKTMIYGSPWSGKTPCYINETAEAAAFVSLVQAPENCITRLKAAESFAALMAATSCLKQDERIYDGICDTLTDIISKTPVFRLKCLPDAEAAQICHSAATI